MGAPRRRHLHEINRWEMKEGSQSHAGHSAPSPRRRSLQVGKPEQCYRCSAAIAAVPLWWITSKVLVTSVNDFHIEPWKKARECSQPRCGSQADPRNPIYFYTGYERFTCSVISSLPVSQIKLQAASGAELHAPGPSACSQTPGWENWVTLGLVLPYNCSYCDFPSPSESQASGTQTSTGGWLLPVSSSSAPGYTDPQQRERHFRKHFCFFVHFGKKNCLLFAF